MDVSALLASLLLFSSGHGEVTLSFNASKFEDSDVYFANVGDTVALSCRDPNAVRPVSIFKGTQRSHRKLKYIKLVDKGELLNNVKVLNEGNYSLNRSHPSYNVYSLVIYNLKSSDTAQYKCLAKVNCSKYDKEKIISIIRKNTKTVSLEVHTHSKSDNLPILCYLVSDTENIFFVGDNLTLQCPKSVAIIRANNSLLDVTEINDGKHFKFLTIQNLTENFNGKKLTCFRTQNVISTEDCCRRLSTISVFSAITMTLLPDVIMTSQGGQARFICQSRPLLEGAFEWDIFANDESYGNGNVKDNSNGSRMSIGSIHFLNPTLSQLNVVCTVTIGSRSKSQNARVYYNIYSNSSITTTENGDNVESSGPASFVIPMTACLVVILTGSIMYGFLYFKMRYRPHRKNKIQEMTISTADDKYEAAVFKKREDVVKAQLGLTANDSEVIENVDYVPFNEVCSKD